GFGSIVEAVASLPLVDARRLAAATAQIIELGAAHLAAAHDLDRVDHRRIEGEHALDAFAIRDLANREVLIKARAGAADADALIGLDAALLALDHLVVDEHRIARLKIRNLLAGGKLRDLLLLELLDQIHGKSPSAAPRAQMGSSGLEALMFFGLSGSGELLRQRSAFVTCSGEAAETGQNQGFLRA